MEKKKVDPRRPCNDSQTTGPHRTNMLRNQWPAWPEYALQQSLQALIHRHESLRTTFQSIDGEAVQGYQRCTATGFSTY